MRWIAVEVRPGLGMDGDDFRAGLGKGVEKPSIVEIIKMDVERLGAVRAQRPHHRGADRDVGTKWPSMTSMWIQSHRRHRSRAPLSQTRKIADRIDGEMIGRTWVRSSFNRRGEQGACKEAVRSPLSSIMPGTMRSRPALLASRRRRPAPPSRCDIGRSARNASILRSPSSGSSRADGETQASARGPSRAGEAGARP